MIANMKTHRVYPEIQVDEITGQWIAKLIDVSGNTKESYSGVVSVDNKNIKEIRAEASKAAHNKFNLIIHKYEV